MITPDINMTDDEMQRMPWTRHLKKADELQRWFASRKEAGRVIDIETCELGRWGAYDCDVYGVRDLPPEMQQIGANRYVRSPTSDGWINEECRSRKSTRCTTASIASSRPIVASIPMIPTSNTFHANAAPRCGRWRTNNYQVTTDWSRIVSVTTESYK
jgi:hypothetical protein